ncbi:potassium/proton antiporter [Lysobacter sp. CFH 32150]|uniref:potassium/proton antiporter n=1 Tax=Lysobacter sp. CFH 32150 TaxID=2927128 RepID=UPI001FA7BA82|nr:potassium/proton antiporter [Lysobacter sp. CFH 32150]MCI4569069.1 potassium/proton antiporter [Lysobacter sp. CFH 32150]
MEHLHAIDLRLLGGALLILAGIASSLLARRFGAPLLLVFLFLGLLLGEDGPGGIQYSDTRFTYMVGALALAVILFDGGLRTRAAHVRGSVVPAVVLASVGVVLTAALTAFAAMKLLELPLLEALLLGTIVASTDAAAVFFLLRAGGLHLERRSGATLEIESGSNDPAAVFLVIALTMWLAGDNDGGIVLLAVKLVWAFGAGLALGYAGGRVIVAALNKYTLPAGLHPWLALAGAVALFALTNLLGGSGYLAVYLAGIVIANRPVRARNEVLSVQDAATWFAQLVMFLLLGLLATPHKVLDVLWPALGVAAFLMFVARPAAVLACLLPFGYRMQEIGFIAWTGLRGAVGIFLASIPLLAGLPNAQLYFNVAFVVVFASLVVQGWTLARAAHGFGVAVPRADPNTRRIQLDLPGQLEYDMVGYRIAPGSAALRGVPLPGRVRLAMVVREGHVLLPEEAGALQAQDYAYFLAPSGQAPRLDWLFAEGGDARVAEQETFGSFILPGDVPLGELATFYGLKLPPRFAASTAAHLFDERFDEQAQVGDRLALGNAVLVVRSLRDDRVAQVGLKFAGVGERLIGGR